MNNKFKISIIIPFYNGEQFFVTLIQSIEKSILLIKPEIVLFEIITVIDSMETSVEPIRNILRNTFPENENVNFLVIKNERNLGVAGSRNAALALATGTHFHLIDQDDEVAPAFYPSILALINDYDFILTNSIVKYQGNSYRSHLLYYLSPALNIKHLLTNEFIRSPGQVVFSRRIARDLKFPEPKLYKGTDDRFFWIRLFLENDDLRACYVKTPLYIANIHDNNYSADSLNLRKSSLENWGLLNSDSDLSPYKKYVKNNILSLKFAANEPMTLMDKIRGGFILTSNFLKLNKIIRFFFKRIKW